MRLTFLVTHRPVETSRRSASAPRWRRNTNAPVTTSNHGPAVLPPPASCGRHPRSVSLRIDSSGLAKFTGGHNAAYPLLHHQMVGRVTVGRTHRAGRWFAMRRGLVAAAVAVAIMLGAVPASAQPAMTSAVTSIAAATIEPAITMRAPATVEAGRLLTVVGRARPPQLGAPVQLWELRGRRWVPIAQSAQAKDGTFTLRLRPRSRP